MPRNYDIYGKYTLIKLLCRKLNALYVYNTALIIPLYNTLYVFNTNTFIIPFRMHCLKRNSNAPGNLSMTQFFYLHMPFFVSSSWFYSRSMSSIFVKTFCLNVNNIKTLVNSKCHS